MAQKDRDMRFEMPQTLPDLNGQDIPIVPALGDMIALLDRLAPQSDAEALRILRNAFADVPLVTRVIACAEWKR